MIQLESPCAPERGTPFHCTLVRSWHERLSHARLRGPSPPWWRPKAREARVGEPRPPSEPGTRPAPPAQGLSTEHRSRCGPRRAENGRAGVTNQRAPPERRAAARPVRAALEGKGRELGKLA